MANTPSANVLAARALLNGAYYVLSYLSLAWEVYAPDPTTIPLALAGGTSSSGVTFPPMPVPAGITASWQCVWGPATDFKAANGPNLAYIASLVEPGTNVPIVTVVVLRGTDTNISDADTFVQVLQDLLGGGQIDFPYPTNNGGPGKIAIGSADALRDVANLTSKGLTITQFLTAYLTAPGNCNPPVAVTGHSLGGCLTTLMAPYLAGQFSQAGITDYAILPNPFAPPTAGDANFVNLYLASTCPAGTTSAYPLGANAWMNTNDAVVHAFADTVSLKTIWPGIPTPGDIVNFVDLVIPQGKYTQIPLSTTAPAFATPVAMMLPDPTSLQPTPATWVTELVYQHFPNTGYWPALYAFAQANKLGIITPPNLSGKVAPPK